VRLPQAVSLRRRQRALRHCPRFRRTCDEPERAKNLPAGSSVEQRRIHSGLPLNIVQPSCPDPNPATTVNEALLNIPVGSITFPAPNFNKQNHWVGNIDYTHSPATQFRFRFTMTNVADIDNSANLPVFLFRFRPSSACSQRRCCTTSRRT
jgi:hypothetical protein